MIIEYITRGYFLKNRATLSLTVSERIQFLDVNDSCFRMRHYYLNTVVIISRKHAAVSVEGNRIFSGNISGVEIIVIIGGLGGELCVLIRPVDDNRVPATGRGFVYRVKFHTEVVILG